MGKPHLKGNIHPLNELNCKEKKLQHETNDNQEGEEIFFKNIR